MKHILLIFIIGFLLYSCGNDPEPYIPVVDFKSNKKAAELIDADNAFASDLFKEVYSLETEENFMISPLSVAIALGMTYNGADMDTKTAFEETLRFNGLSRHEINAYHGALIDLLLNIDPKVKVEIANSIWLNHIFTLQQEFADSNVYYYDAEIASLDFYSGGAVDIINGWAEEKTHGKVKNVLDFIPADVAMYLINALYFYGTWTYEFDKEDNEPIQFEKEDGSVVEVDGMKMEADLKVFYHEDFSLLELPYGDEKYSMVIVLPQEDKNVADVLEYLDAENWNTWMSRLTEVETSIHIPKFRFEYKTLLNDALKNMGLEIAFTGDADFSLMVEEISDLYISRVIHKTFVDMNEKGTEAAAVTVVEVSYESAGLGEVFVVDRPFLFVIREKTSGANVFIGKVGNPEY